MTTPPPSLGQGGEQPGLSSTHGENVKQREHLEACSRTTYCLPSKCGVPGHFQLGRDLCLPARKLLPGYDFWGGWAMSSTVVVVAAVVVVTLGDSPL